MGTNYYIRTKPCPCCKRSERIYHIGKSSGGWCFSLHVDPSEGITGLDDVMRKTSGKGVEIVDEYGDIISIDEMKREITERTGNENRSVTPCGYDSWDEFHRINHSQFGPKGLLRHRIDGSCIGHGSGTWDLINSEFS